MAEEHRLERAFMDSFNQGVAYVANDTACRAQHPTPSLHLVGPCWIGCSATAVVLQQACQHTSSPDHTVTDLGDEVVQQAGGQLILVAVLVEAPDLQLALQLGLFTPKHKAIVTFGHQQDCNINPTSSNSCSIA